MFMNIDIHGDVIASLVISQDRLYKYLFVSLFFILNYLYMLTYINVYFRDLDIFEYK